MPLKSEEVEAIVEHLSSGDEDKPLTITEAKRRLAISIGVDASNIKITVEA